MENNASMYTSVMEKLNFEPRLDASNITVCIHGNHDTVLLGGHVGSFAEKILAEKALKNLTNVRAIANDIQVNLTTKYKKSDIDIAKDVTQSLKSNFFVPHEDIKIVVRDGVVTLSREVEWSYEKDYAFNAAHNHFGVKAVINDIVIKPSATINTKIVQDKITKEFERHAKIDTGKIKIQVIDSKIILKGMVSYFEKRDDVENVALSIPGVKEVQNELTVNC
jgi:osmotically-inducible protein OsmY